MPNDFLNSLIPVSCSVAASQPRFIPMTLSSRTINPASMIPLFRLILFPQSYPRRNLYLKLCIQRNSKTLYWISIIQKTGDTMRKILAVILVIAFLISACTTSGNNADNADVSDNAAAEVSEFSIVAKNWEFDPAEITVNKGDTVRLLITSVDVDHGFAIPEFGVSEKLSPGEEVTVEFVADKTGEFTFFCNVFCGSGHQEMRGRLIVQ